MYLFAAAWMQTSDFRTRIVLHPLCSAHPQSCFCHVSRMCFLFGFFCVVLFKTWSSFCCSEIWMRFEHRSTSTPSQILAFGLVAKTSADGAFHLWPQEHADLLTGIRERPSALQRLTNTQDARGGIRKPTLAPLSRQLWNSSTFLEQF